MPTSKKGEPEPSNVIGSISKLVGTVVGTTVVTGKRVIRSVKSSNRSLSNKRGGKTVHASAERKKKAVRKTGVKTTTTKKKKAVKRKGTGSSGTSRAPKKAPAKSSAKKKKVVAHRKKTTSSKTKKAIRTEELSDSSVGLITGPEIDAGTNVPIGGQEPQQ
jgi:hypothetical protein